MRRKNEIWHVIGISKAGRVRYSISNMGRCRWENLLNQTVRESKGRYNKFTGYYVFDGLGYVHRLVAQFFLTNPNPAECVEVDHIDSDRSNNKASNLRYVDRFTNRRRRHAQRLRKQNHRATSHAGQVLEGKRYDAATNTWETRTWRNGRECAKDLNCSHVLVYLAALPDGDKGKRSARTAKGWRLHWTDAKEDAQ